jgi:hypothetical protein
VTVAGLPVHSTDDVHQFRDLAALIDLVAVVDRVFHAMGHVILENLFLHAAKRGSYRRDLSDDVDAVPVILDHLREPANLAFDAEDTINTCPMHPQIRQVGPGNCPICGMALEPELATADSGPNPELIDMTCRFWVGLAVSIPVVILEMGGHLIGGHGWIDLYRTGSSSFLRRLSCCGPVGRSSSAAASRF